MLGSLIPLAVVDWERTVDSHEREIASGYQFARALIQERLNSARLLAEQAADQAIPTASAADGATILILAPDGKLQASSSGRSLPRLAEIMPQLPPTPLAGIEIDDQGALVAAATYPSGGRVIVAVLPFTTADARSIKEATGLDSSFFAGQTRVVTTLAALPVPLPTADWQALTSEAGHLRWTADPALGGQPSLQIQVPLYGLDGALVGAYAIGRSGADQWALLRQRLWFWAGIVLGGVMLVFLLAIWLRWRLLVPVRGLQERLALLSDAEATEELELDCELEELQDLVQRANQLAAAHAALLRNTERLSERLIQAQNLAALGQLAAGVAHDLNNPLTTIMGLADIIQTADMDPETRRDLAVIRRQAERSGRIVRGLLSFARRQRAEPQWVSLNDLITQTLELLAYQARVANIRLETRLTPDLPLTWADPSQIQQVLFNLANNAVQAMASAHGQGRLLIESSCSPPAPGAPHGRIAIRVQDDGPGIPDAVLPRLFQPYFTTKEPGDGTGLGLAIAASVIRRHSGRIWAENNPGGGASFFVELPVTPEPPQGEASLAPGASAPAVAPRNILLADSDPQRVGQLARFLRRQGHLLSTAGDGMLARNKMELEEFDLVLCGVEMSRLDGRQLYNWARAYHPRMANRFIFITNGSLSTEMEAFLQSTRAPVLHCPLQEEAVNAAIIQAVRQATGSPGTPA